MSSAIPILEHLLDEASVNSKEHVIETASRHVSNVESRLSENFDSLVHEISTIWGAPQFNSTVPGSEHEDEEEEDIEEQSTSDAGGAGKQDASRKKKKLRNVVPPWSNGTSRSGGQCKALRLSYWKRPDQIGYVVLRVEIDTKKNMPLSYDLILGARRRGAEPGRNVAKFKQVEGQRHWFSPVMKWLTGR